MAADKDQLPLISVPVGSVAEVRDLDPRLLKTVATCSEHSDSNAGCAQWENCDLEHKGERPHNRVARTFKRDGSSRVCAEHCMHLIRKRLQVENNGGLTDLIGDEGDTYEMTGTARVHPLRETTCHACMRNECFTHRPLAGKEAEFVCKPIPPAAEHPLLARFSIMRQVRKDRGTMQRFRTERQFFNQPSTGKEKDVESPAEPEGVGAGPKLDGRTRAGKATRAQGG